MFYQIIKLPKFTASKEKLINTYIALQYKMCLFKQKNVVLSNKNWIF
jgi:hypothetical protein